LIKIISFTNKTVPFVYKQNIVIMDTAAGCVASQVAYTADNHATANTTTCFPVIICSLASGGFQADVNMSLKIDVVYFHIIRRENSM